MKELEKLNEIVIQDLATEMEMLQIYGGTSMDSDFNFKCPSNTYCPQVGSCGGGGTCGSGTSGNGTSGNGTSGNGADIIGPPTYMFC